VRPIGEGPAPQWDGHTTEQKYERLAELTRMTAEGCPVNNEGWLTTERELNDRRAAMAAELQRVTAERDALRAELRERQAIDVGAYRGEVARITAQRDDARKGRNEALDRLGALPQSMKDAMREIRQLTREIGDARAARDDARAAYATLRNAFTRGKQSGWTARLSGTVLARCDAQAMREPGAEAEADPVAAEREQTAMCRHCLWDIVRDGGRWRVGLDADDPFACEGPADGHAPLAPDGGPR
jgi:hypothetical protein